VSTARRHLQAVPPSASETPSVQPLGGTVEIPMERYCELLTLEILAAEVAAKTWQHRRRGWVRIAVDTHRALVNVVRPEFVEQYLPEHEREAYRASLEES